MPRSLAPAHKEMCREVCQPVLERVTGEGSGGRGKLLGVAVSASFLGFQHCHLSFLFLRFHAYYVKFAILVVGLGATGQGRPDLEALGGRQRASAAVAGACLSCSCMQHWGRVGPYRGSGVCRSQGAGLRGCGVKSRTRDKTKGPFPRPWQVDRAFAAARSTHVPAKSRGNSQEPSSFTLVPENLLSIHCSLSTKVSLSSPWMVFHHWSAFSGFVKTSANCAHVGTHTIFP